MVAWALVASAFGQQLRGGVASDGGLRVFSVSPSRFPREFATELEIKGQNFVEGMVVAIDGLSGNLYSSDLSVYRPMRALNATVKDSETAVVTTVPSQNAGPCSVRASPTGAGNWTDKASAPVASVFAAVDMAVGRRPYTVERTGALILRLDAAFWGPSNVSARATLASGDLAAPVALVDARDVVADGRDLRLAFDLDALFADRVEGNVTLVVVGERGNVSVAKRFSRAVPSESYEGSIVAVDHETKAIAHARGVAEGDPRATPVSRRSRSRAGSIRPSSTAATASSTATRRPSPRASTSTSRAR